MELIKQKMYRLAYNMENPRLRGKPVVFLGYLKLPWDINRAEVVEIKDDGTLGCQWLVTISSVINH